jgi:hypothetical protein
MQGEIAIAAVNENGITLRNPLSNDCTMNVTTTTNAWPTNLDAMFAGVVRNARPLKSKDPKGTIAYVGTQTVMNTGPEEIMPGDEVYFSMTPYATIEEGQMRNVIEVDEAGQPGHQETLNAEGVLAAKFRVTTLPLRDNSTYALIRRGTIAIDESVMTTSAKWISLTTRPPVRPELDAALESAKKLFLEAPADFPVMAHLYVYAAASILSVVLTITNRAYLQDSATEIESWIQPLYFKDKHDKRRKYTSAIDRERLAEDASRLPVTALPASAAPQQISSATLVLTRMLERAKTETICDVHNFIRRRLIGKCIRGNVSGAGIDIACGYTHK